MQYQNCPAHFSAATGKTCARHRGKTLLSQSSYSSELPRRWSEMDRMQFGCEPQEELVFGRVDHFFGATSVGQKRLKDLVSEASKMKPLYRIPAALIVGLTVCALAPASSDAQSIRGQLGSTSEATIRLNVSVAPRFTVQDVGGATSEAGPGRVHFLSNVPISRFHIVREPIAPNSGAVLGGGDAAAHSSALFLIVPE